MAYQIKRSCVFRTLRVLFFIGKLYGMTTFSYIYDDKTKVLVQHCDRIRFALFLLFYAILLVLNYTWSIASLDNTFTLFNTGIRYLLMYSITMVIFTVIYNFLFHQQLFNIIIQIDEHDLEVHELGLIQDFETRQRMAQSYIVCCFVGIFILSIQCYIYLDRIISDDLCSEIIFFLTITMINGSYAVNLVQFQIFLCIITARFDALNIFGRNYFKTLGWLNKKPRTSALAAQDMIYRLAKIHERLCSILNNVSQYFAIHIVTTIGGNFALTVFALHCLYRGLSENNKQLYHMSLCYISLTIYFNFMNLFMFALGSAVSRAGKNTGVVIHKGMVHIEDKAVLEKMELFSIQVMHASPRVSFGLFVLDWELAFQMTSSIVTYLIILIQLQNFVIDRNHINVNPIFKKFSNVINN